MFSSHNNTSNNNDPIVYIDHSILQTHFSTDTITTPYTKLDDLPLSFFNFPSPYHNQCDRLDLKEYHDVFRNQDNQYDDDQFLHQKTLMISTDNSVINMTDCRNIITTDHQQQLQVLPRKRPASKTDRHSKINTANGPRDRRMRLSLEVARKFFGLQDMLGYDKPSRTVEWLLIQAKTEINKLTKGQVSQMNDTFGFAVSKSPSSTSDAEAVSGTDDKAATELGSFSKGKASKKEKKDRIRKRKTSFRPLARDLREKARDRARARTAKIMWSRRFCYEATNINDLNKFSSWSNQDQNKNINHLLQSKADNMDCSIFNCLQKAGINQEHQLTSSVLWQTMESLEQ